MNKTITSREAILSVGIEIVVKSGIPGLNIRDVAKRCGVSVGSIYNYFPTKSDLAVATVEAVWKDIMSGYKLNAIENSFADNIRSLFTTIQKGLRRYPSFFAAHSISLATTDREKGRSTMDNYLNFIKSGLLVALNNDTAVKSDVFTAEFDKEGFVNFVFGNMVALLLKQAESCDFLIETIRRILYK